MEGHLYLPIELISYILIRLPWKTLLQCTSVCKSWYILITSHNFINSHLENQYNLGNQLLVYGGNKYSLHKDDEEFAILSEFESPFDAQTTIVSSCNGVICLYNMENHTLYLWNPCIRKILEIPPTETWHTAAFGFCSETNDYKIVAITICLRKSVARVYELRTGSWKIIKGSEQFLKHYIIHGEYSHVFLNDKIYWVGSDRYTTRDFWVMITLDLKKYEFGVLKMPPSEGSPYSFEVTLFSSGCLALIYSDIRGVDVQCRVWVMNDGDGCWTKMFASILPDAHLVTPVTFLKNGDALVMKSRWKGLTKIIDLVSCDVKNQKTKGTGVSRVGGVCARKFIPSLLLLYKPPFHTARSL